MDWKCERRNAVKIASEARAPLPRATVPNQRWAVDFVTDRLVDGSMFRVPTVVNQFSRLNLALEMQKSFTRERVSEVLNSLTARH
jgi:putative transposase